MVEQKPEQKRSLSDALRTINQDKNRYPASFGQNGYQTTKKEIFVRLFGHKARHGEAHIPGYYEKYQELSIVQINKIIAEHIIKLADATILMHQARFFQRDLEKAKKSAKKF